MKKVKCIKDTIGFYCGHIYGSDEAESHISVIVNGTVYQYCWKLLPEYFQEVIDEKENMSPDFSAVIEIAKGIIQEIKDGTYHEDNDNARYIYEEVMEAIYGKDVWKLF